MAREFGLTGIGRGRWRLERRRAAGKFGQFLIELEFALFERGIVRPQGKRVVEFATRREQHRVGFVLARILSVGLPLCDARLAFVEACIELADDVLDLFDARIEGAFQGHELSILGFITGRFEQQIFGHRQHRLVERLLDVRRVFRSRRAELDRLDGGDGLIAREDLLGLFDDVVGGHAFAGLQGFDTGGNVLRPSAFRLAELTRVEHLYFGDLGQCFGDVEVGTLEHLRQFLLVAIDGVIAHREFAVLALRLQMR